MRVTRNSKIKNTNNKKNTLKTTLAIDVIVIDNFMKKFAVNNTTDA